MKINTGAETPNNAQRPENTARSNEVARTKSSEDVDHSNEVTASDRVELSAQARDIQRARQVAQGAPEIRADKVEAARRAVQSGNLNLKGEDLAEKLLQQETLPNGEQ
jgi:negative regulator of flagellin synthesis FlgM